MPTAIAAGFEPAVTATITASTAKIARTPRAKWWRPAASTLQNSGPAEEVDASWNVFMNSDANRAAAPAMQASGRSRSGFRRAEKSAPTRTPPPPASASASAERRPRDQRDDEEEEPRRHGEADRRRDRRRVLAGAHVPTPGLSLGARRDFTRSSCRPARPRRTARSRSQLKGEQRPHDRQRRAREELHPEGAEEHCLGAGVSLTHGAQAQALGRGP